MILYRSFKIGKKYKTQSNYFVDYVLKIPNELWCIRKLEEFTEEAKKMVCFKKISLGCQKIIFQLFIESFLLNENKISINYERVF